MNSSALYISGSNVEPRFLDNLKSRFQRVEVVTRVTDAIGVLRDDPFDHLFLCDHTLGLSLDQALSILDKTAINSEIHVVSKEKLEHKGYDVVNVNELLYETSIPVYESDKSWSFLISLENLKTLSNGDSTFVKSMVEAYLDEMPIYIQELEKALKEEDQYLLAQMAHKLKGPINMLDVHVCDVEISELDELNFDPDYQMEMETVLNYSKKILDCAEEVLNQLKSKA